MTSDELKIELEQRGWKFGPEHSGTGISWYAWRSLEGAADCTDNEKPPSFTLKPFELNLNGSTWRSVQFEVVGEVGDVWVQLMAYSVPMDEALEKESRCAEILRAAWNAAARANLLTRG